MNNLLEPLGITLANRKLLAPITLQRLQWLILALLFAAFYAPIIPGLVNEWHEHSTFSYGFLVPFIAAFLVWERWSEIKKAPVLPSPRVGLLLLIATTIGVAGYALGDTFSTRVSMILALGSLLWLLLGREILKKLLFPLFYLSLMIPVPYVFIKNLTLYLRYSDASHAADVLQLLGVPVYREAYFLHIPNMTLEVADVCSGVSSVFALFALGVIYAHYLPLRRGLKVLLVALTFPFAIIANQFRIVLTTVLAYNFGPVVFQTLFHAFSGMFTFVVALLILIAFGEGLKKKIPVPAQNASLFGQTASGSSRGSKRGAWISFILGAVILLAGVFASKQLEAGPGIRLASDLNTVVPTRGYHPTATILEDGYKDPNAENSLAKVLAAKDGSRIDLFVGYSGKQTAGNRLLSPELIFPDNWNSVWVKPAEVALNGATIVHGSWIMARKSDSQELILYWYQIGRRTYGGELEHRLEQFRRSVIERRNDGAVIRLATPLRNGDSLEKAEERLRTFTADLYPRLVKVLPE
jgi:EpsI family protein